jgi:AbrB family looped-hinge helix DNA binding protein
MARLGSSQPPVSLLFFTYNRKGKNQTRVSSKHQVTIPAGPFRTAGLEPGDTLKVEAEGAGRVVLTRVDELVDRYSGCLDTGDLRERVEGLHEEWR